MTLASTLSGRRPAMRWLEPMPISQRTRLRISAANKAHHKRQVTADPTASALRLARVAAGFSVTDLALRAGVSRTTLINAELQRTKPRWDTALRLSTALGKKPATLGFRP
jgi:DNA-binding XRE family transcriptional regulator